MATKFQKILQSLNPFQHKNEDRDTYVMPVTDPETAPRKNHLPLDKIVYQPESRITETIANWRFALDTAEDYYRPRRNDLYRIYREIIIDPHLAAIMNIRRQRIHSMPPKIYDANSIEQPQLTALFNSQWFDNFVANIIDSIYWGHSLMDVYINEQRIDIKLIPRDNVRPECGEVVLYKEDEKGIPYRIPQFADTLIEIGHPYCLGLLNNAAPIVLTKRNTQTCWAEFCEVFGQPIVYAKTASKDEFRKSKIMEQLRKLARAARAVFEPDEEIVMLESKRGDDPRLFKDLIELLNKELSKLIVGQTMTTEAGGSFSQAKIHDLLFDDLTLSDKRFVEQVCNQHLLPKLIKKNILPEGSILELEKDITLSPTGQANVLNIISQFWEIEESYIRDTFGIPTKGPRKEPINKNISQTNSTK